MNKFELMFEDGLKIEAEASATAEEVDRQISVARANDAFMVFDQEDGELFVRAGRIVAFKALRAAKVKFGRKKEEKE